MSLKLLAARSDATMYALAAEPPYFSVLVPTFGTSGTTLPAIWIGS